MKMDSTSFETKRTVQALNFFLNQEKSQSMSKMKLLKLLWLVDRYTLRNYGYLLSGDKYYALPHGPVGSATKDILDANQRSATTKSYWGQYISVVSNKDIKSNRSIDFGEFSEADLSALRAVWSVYGSMSPASLRDYSHKFPEWLRFEQQLKDAEDQGRQASYAMKLEDFFTDPGNTLHKTIFNEDEESLRASMVWYKQEQQQKALLA